MPTLTSRHLPRLVSQNNYYIKTSHDIIILPNLNIQLFFYFSISNNNFFRQFFQLTHNVLINIIHPTSIRTHAPYV